MPQQLGAKKAINTTSRKKENPLKIFKGFIVDLPIYSQLFWVKSKLIINTSEVIFICKKKNRTAVKTIWYGKTSPLALSLPYDSLRALWGILFVSVGLSYPLSITQ